MTKKIILGIVLTFVSISFLPVSTEAALKKGETVRHVESCVQVGTSGIGVKYLSGKEQVLISGTKEKNNGLQFISYSCVSDNAYSTKWALTNPEDNQGPEINIENLLIKTKIVGMGGQEIPVLTYEAQIFDKRAILKSATVYHRPKKDDNSGNWASVGVGISKYTDDEYTLKGESGLFSEEREYEVYFSAVDIFDNYSQTPIYTVELE